jgi:carboxyvinyl-carboxyphosphonate phosphorylmutase
MKKLAELIKSKEIIAAPGAYDMLSARLVQEAGFQAVYMTGNGQSTSHLGLPDLGLMTMTEMISFIRSTVQSVDIAVIADCDTGFGTLLNIQRTVREAEMVGCQAIQIEDQVLPKKCGHEKGRIVISEDEMCAKLHAATLARKSPDFLLVARTDSRTISIDEAIRRGNAYAKAGADIIFVESPESVEEMKRIAKEIKAPNLVNIVETGRTPCLSLQELQSIGYKIAIFPVSSALTAMYAVRKMLKVLKESGSTNGYVDQMISLKDYHTVTRFYELQVYEQELAKWQLKK